MFFKSIYYISYIFRFSSSDFRFPTSKYIFLLFSIIFFIFAGCGESYTPRPRGYFRITFPKKEYKQFKSDAPFTFEIPKYSVMREDKSPGAEKWWYNLEFPTLKGTLHLSYKKVDKNITEYVEDARTLVNKHTIKADAIEPEIFEKKDKNVIAVFFEIKGNAASPYQFFATDSTSHFLRASMYFNVYPNKDSLAPVFKFIKKDVLKIIETLEWQK